MGWWFDWLMGWWFDWLMGWWFDWLMGWWIGGVMIELIYQWIIHSNNTSFIRWFRILQYHKGYHSFTLWRNSEGWKIIKPQEIDDDCWSVSTNIDFLEMSFKHQ
jgi:hypothetical protein